MPITDFHDSFSPMLVKDLRALLKSPRFVKTFISLQVFLIILTTTQILGYLDRQSNWFFWAIITLICLTTLKENSFEKSEDTGKNMELIRVSGLSPWQIIFGKWCSTNGQIFLIITSILPYLLFRYFSGTAELTHDLIVFVFLSTGLAVLSAISLGFTSSRSPLIRIMIILALVIGVICMFSKFNFTNPMHVVSTFLFSGFLTLYSLQAGSFRLEESTSNHAVLKRLIILSFGLIFLVISFFTKADDVTSIFLLMIFSFGILECFDESIPQLKVALAPFTKLPFSKLYAPLLIPGWPSTFLLAVVCLIMLMLHSQFSIPVLQITGLCLFGLSFIVVPLCVVFWLVGKVDFPPKLVFIGVLIIYSLILKGTVLHLISYGLLSNLSDPKTLPAVACVICTFLLPYLIGRKWYRAIWRVLTQAKQDQ